MELEAAAAVAAAAVAAAAAALARVSACFWSKAARMAAASGAPCTGAGTVASAGACAGASEACFNEAAEAAFAIVEATASDWTGASLPTGGGGDGEVRFWTLELLEDIIVDDASVTSAGAITGATEWWRNERTALIENKILARRNINV